MIYVKLDCDEDEQVRAALEIAALFAESPTIIQINVTGKRGAIVWSYY